MNEANDECFQLTVQLLTLFHYVMLKILRTIFEISLAPIVTELRILFPACKTVTGNYLW